MLLRLLLRQWPKVNQMPFMKETHCRDQGYGVPRTPQGITPALHFMNAVDDLHGSPPGTHGYIVPGPGLHLFDMLHQVFKIFRYVNKVDIGRVDNQQRTF